MSDDIKHSMKLKILEKRWKIQFLNIFLDQNIEDPTTNFDWEYILIENKKLKMLGVCQEVKLLFIQEY